MDPGSPGGIPLTQRRTGRLGRRSLTALAALAILVRILYFAQAASGPASTAHRWDQGDMGFFHAMATRIASGDLFLDGTFHPMEHRWRVTIAREYLLLHPDEASALAREAAATDPPRSPEALLWDRWLGPKSYYQEPLYTYLLAGSFRLFGPDVRWVFAWQMLFGVGTVLLVARVADRRFGPAAGLVAGLLAVAYAPLLFYETVLLRATLLAFTTIAIVLVAQRTIDRDRPADWLVAGFLTGVAILLKAIFVPFALALAVHALAAAATRSVRLRRVGALAAGVLIAVSPVIARNLAVGAPALTLASPGLANLIFGLGGAAEPRLGASAYDFASYGEIMHRTGGRLVPAVVETLRTHGSAGALLGFLGRKLLYVWHWYEIPNNVNFYLAESGTPILRALPVRFLGIAPLALIGIVLAGRRNLRAWPLPLAVVSVVAALTIFAHNSRSRIALVPVLIPYCAHALVTVVRWLRQHDFARAAAVVAATAVLTILMGRPLPEGTARIRAVDYAVPLETFYVPRVQAAAAAGDWTRAADTLREAIRRGPAFARDPARIPDVRTAEERALARAYAEVHRDCADYLERTGHGAEAATHRDLARRMTRALPE